MVVTGLKATKFLWQASQAIPVEGMWRGLSTPMALPPATWQLTQVAAPMVL
jgi:hypothetical protein